MSYADRLKELALRAKVDDGIWGVMCPTRQRGRPLLYFASPDAAPVRYDSTYHAAAETGVHENTVRSSAREGHCTRAGEFRYADVPLSKQPPLTGVMLNTTQVRIGEREFLTVKSAMAHFGVTRRQIEYAYQTGRFRGMVVERIRQAHARRAPNRDTRLFRSTKFVTRGGRDVVSSKVTSAIGCVCDNRTAEGGAYAVR